MTDRETSSFSESDNPKTNILDHIVHLCPPAALEDSSQRFRDLGFHVLPGGTHADGLTYNALIVLESGIYIELISFTHPVEYYPAGSQERRSREAHRWAQKSPGWIDFAFLGNGSKTHRISDVVNTRAQKDGLGQMYATETEGGRLRPDGIELKWLITSPIQQSPLPFFCGDVTSRDLRVPTKPLSNTEHPSSALDIYEIEVLTTRGEFPLLSARLSSTLGNSTAEAVDSVYFALDSPGKASGRTRRLGLRIRDETTTFGENAIVAVTFLAAKTDRERDTTPYGKLQWRQA